MRFNKFFLAVVAFGIMLLNNTATAHADWNQSGTGMNAYSGQVMLGSLDRHNLADFKRSDEMGAGDSLFGSTSVQAPVTLVAGANIEIEIMEAGVEVDNRYVNGKPCPTNKTFNAFVTPVATCSSHFGSNFSGFRAQAEEMTATGVDGTKKWKPMLYMNVRGRWMDLSTEPEYSGMTGGDTNPKDQCAQVLVQKICQ